MDQKVLRRDHDFSTRWLDADKKLRGLYHPMVNTTYKSLVDLKNNYQLCKLKQKFNFIKI